jgi:serine phosphatase RsbU (regulator of sigma subunit)
LTSSNTKARHCTSNAAIAGEEFGEKRLIDFLVSHRHLKAQALADAVINRIREFSEGAHQHDDLTLMVIRAL